MTIQDIEKMPAGVELNRLVAVTLGEPERDYSGTWDAVSMALQPLLNCGWRVWCSLEDGRWIGQAINLAFKDRVKVSADSGPLAVSRTVACIGVLEGLFDPKEGG